MIQFHERWLYLTKLKFCGRRQLGLNVDSQILLKLCARHKWIFPKFRSETLSLPTIAHQHPYHAAHLVTASASDSVPLLNVCKLYIHV